ncbi:MAG TPA: cytochrome c [Verrucomicrobiae bacterium]|nr:cytochrome c [Verrucomicrobiae bacterium]
MTRFSFVALGALLLATVLPAAAGPAPDKAATCAACHGADGKAVMPIYPTLAGQYANYLSRALHEYRAGTRKNAVMAAQAASLSDADIEELAKYFANLPSPLYTPGHGKPQD